MPPGSDPVELLWGKKEAMWQKVKDALNTCIDKQKATIVAGKEVIDKQQADIAALKSKLEAATAEATHFRDSYAASVARSEAYQEEVEKLQAEHLESSARMLDTVTAERAWISDIVWHFSSRHNNFEVTSCKAFQLPS